MVLYPAHFVAISPTPLEHLVADLRQARENFRMGRMEPEFQVNLLDARQALMDAVEAYVNALIAQGLPVPPQLRDELRLQRSIRRRPDGGAWRRHDKWTRA